MFPDMIVTSLMQDSINNLVAKNGQVQPRLTRLHNKALGIHFSDLNKTLVFVFTDEVKVVANFDGYLDCTVSLPLTIAPKLRDKSQFTTLLKQDKLHIDGDIDVIQQFVALLEELNFDVAEWLSTYTGDVVAHSLTTGVKSTISMLKSMTENQQRYFAEVLVEEWRFIPSALEVAFFADSVDEINTQTVQLEKRLNALEASLKNKIEQ